MPSASVKAVPCRRCDANTNSQIKTLIVNLLNLAPLIQCVKSC